MFMEPYMPGRPYTSTQCKIPGHVTKTPVNIIMYTTLCSIPEVFAYIILYCACVLAVRLAVGACCFVFAVLYVIRSVQTVLCKIYSLVCSISIHWSAASPH